MGPIKKQEFDQEDRGGYVFRLCVGELEEKRVVRLSLVKNKRELWERLGCDRKLYNFYFALFHQIYFRKEISTEKSIYELDEVEIFKKGFYLTYGIGLELGMYFIHRLCTLGLFILKEATLVGDEKIVGILGGRWEYFEFNELVFPITPEELRQQIRVVKGGSKRWRRAGG